MSGWRTFGIALGWALSLSAQAQEGTMQVPHSDEESETPRAPQLTRAPALLHFVQGDYPAEAQAQGLTGEVGLELDLGADGKVTAVRVVTAAGHGFDEAAVAAAKQFTFSPAELDGKPAAVTIGYTYHFVLAPPVKLEPAARATAALVHVAGSVLERSSKNPLPGVALSVDGQAVAETGAGGSFALDLPAGTHHLTVFAPGYQPLDKVLALVAGKSLALLLFLRPRIEGMFQTVVKAEAEKDVVEVYTLDREQIRRTPGTFGDPLHVITDLPGVARTPFDLGFLVVRGADPLDTVVYLDGLAMPLLYHFGGGPAVINPEFIDKVDFYPGGQGARYGHGIGGVVDAESRQLKHDRPRVTADLNLAFAQVFAEVPLPGDWVVAAAGRRSYFDFLIQPFLSSGTVIVPYFWDYQLKADQGRPGDRNTFGIMAYGSNDTLRVLSNTFASSQSGLDLNYNTQFHRLVGRWSYKSDRFSSVVRPEIGLENLSLAFGTSNGSIQLYNVALRHDMAYELSARQHLNFGEDITYSWFNATVVLPQIQNYQIFPGSSVQEPQQDLSRFFNGLRVGLWAEDVVKLRSNFTLIPGVRLEGYDEVGHFLGSVDPRLVFRWAVTSKLTLKGSVGLYHEPPPLQDFDKQFGNPALGLLQAIQYSGGFEYTLLPALHLDIVGFYSDRSGLLGGFLGPAPPGQVAISNAGLGRAYGMEVYLHQDITERLFGWISYTLSRSEFTGGLNQPFVLSPFDETHILSAVLSYNLGASFILGGRFRLVSGEPFTPVSSSTYDADQNSYMPIYGALDSQRLGLYKQLDVRLDKEFAFDRFKLDLYLDVWNVTNATNEEFRVYDYRSRTYASLPGYPILPLLGFRGEY